MNPVAELQNIGYSLRVEGMNIRYAWKGAGDPPAEKAKPLLQELKARKEELLPLLEGGRLSRKIVLQVKSIESEAFAKGWSRDELWHPRFVGGKDRLHESGLAFVMDSGEVIRLVTEAFIELVNRRGTVLKFYKLPISPKGVRP